MGVFDWEALNRAFGGRSLPQGVVGPDGMYELMIADTPEGKQQQDNGEPKQRGINEEQSNMLNELQGNLMDIGTSFRQDTQGVQPLPSPYNGAGFRGHPNIGQEGLMALLQYLSSQGGMR